jgi:hypothetical protein
MMNDETESITPWSAVRRHCVGGFQIAAVFAPLVEDVSHLKNCIFMLHLTTTTATWSDY